MPVNDFWSHWNFDPWILSGILLACLLYGRGIQVLWRQAGTGRGIRRRQVAAFYGGIYILLVTLVSPLDALAHTLFSAHMAQHMALILLAAPLLTYSVPLLAFLWALPKPARITLMRTWQASPLYTLWQLISQPLNTWILFAVTLWVWHLPSLYQAAVIHPAVHALEHVTMLGSAYLFWWLVLQPSGYRRLNHGLAILFVFTTSVHGTVLGALITLAPQPLYPVYMQGAAAWGMTLLEDQQLAGIIMRVPTTYAFLITVATLFLFWLADMERRASGRRVKGKLQNH